MAKKKTTGKTKATKTKPASGSPPAQIHGPLYPKRIDEASDSPGDCGRCKRPVLSTPYFTLEGLVFCCGDCLNDHERKAGRDIYTIPEGFTARPASSGNDLAREESPFVPVGCPKCGSQNRERFTGNVRRVETGGNCPLTGRRYNVVLFRNTRCLDCRQAITAKSYEWDSAVS